VEDPADLRERAKTFLEMATRLRSIRPDSPAIKDMEEMAQELRARAEAIERKKTDKP
jgi:hypothetical protein